MQRARLIAAALALACLTTAAVAGTMNLLHSGKPPSAGGGGGGCTNKFDFSVSCNSQYLGTGGIF